MKKSELKTGDCVTKRNGNKYLVLLDTHIGDVLSRLDEDNWSRLSKYTENLMSENYTEFDIVEVSRASNHMFGLKDFNEFKTVWERKEKLPYNDWYTNSKGKGCVYFFSENVAYGLSLMGNWFPKEGDWGRLNEEDWVPCPIEKVREMLLVAAKREFKKGDTITYQGHTGKIVGEIYWASGSDCVSVLTDNDTRGNKNFPLLDVESGTWAEIIETPVVPQYTMSEVKDLLEKHLGTHFTIKND